MKRNSLEIRIQDHQNLENQETATSETLKIKKQKLRNGTSEIFGFLKKRLVKFSRLRNPTAQFFQSKKQQRFCIYYILKKST